MNQKLEDQLQLALLTPEELRERTNDLNVGYQTAGNFWELIVKYHGNLDKLEALNITVEYLIAGYAILTVPASVVEQMADFEEIEYVEKPKSFFYDMTDPVSDSCILELPGQGLFLSGRDVLIAVLDSGIDLSRREFRRTDGTTRVKALWDQTLETDESGYLPPSGFTIGGELTEQEMNALLAQNTAETKSRLPGADLTGHGTAVAMIAAGNAAGYRGAAPEAELLIVKLGNPGKTGFPRTTQIMRGVTWALQRAKEVGKPMVINLSFGNSYGAHDGSSLLERFLDNASEIGRTAICVGSGNDGSSAGHTSGRIDAETEEKEVRLAVGRFERNLSLELWKDYKDSFAMELMAPSGRSFPIATTYESQKQETMLDGSRILVYVGEPIPYSTLQEIYLEWLPENTTYIESGIWTVRIRGRKVSVGGYDMYLPSIAVRSRYTVFLEPSTERTLTIPSTAHRVITVGAYDSVYNSYAEFSGRGQNLAQAGTGIIMGDYIKPDLVAPGVNILIPDLTNSLGISTVTGTSFATPIVSGAAALLMEWGIVLGRDPFLYGDKLKAFLRKGTKPVRGTVPYPNPLTGYGALCVEKSIPYR